MLFKAFLEGPCHRSVDLLKLSVQVCESCLRLLVGRLPVGTPQLPTPFFAIAFWQVTNDVLALVPLAALNESAVGRGRPVGREALEETSAMTDTFIDGVTEIAKEQDGDAEVLLEIIREREDERVQGFYSPKADDLENYFLENGYLTEKEPLSEEEMCQRVLAELAEERRRDFVTVEGLEQVFGRLEVDTT